MDKEKNNTAAKKKGLVVSDKMDKTIVVAVTEFKAHPKYGKKYKSTKRYKVQDTANEHKVGEIVEIVETKPISKDKKYKVI
jgi:small subunit ribosomal protein S17